MTLWDSVIRTTKNTRKTNETKTNSMHLFLSRHPPPTQDTCPNALWGTGSPSSQSYSQGGFREDNIN